MNIAFLPRNHSFSMVTHEGFVNELEGRRISFESSVEYQDQSLHKRDLNAEFCLTLNGKPFSHDACLDLHVSYLQISTSLFNAASVAIITKEL